MASGLVLSLLSSASHLLDLLRSQPAAASCPPCGETADLQRLKRLLTRVQATLDDSGEREVRDSSVKLWIEELSDLARDAEDVLEDCRYELLKRRVQELQGTADSTSRKRKQDGGNHGISQRIGYITRQFEEISRDRAALQLRPEDGERTAGRDSQWESRETSHLLDESLVFGRSKEKACIIKSLLCCSQGTGIHVLPIVGMGGIGKTTMAQIVYNDGRVQEMFDLRGWVHVSEKFDLRRLTIEITNSLTRRPCGFYALSSVHDVLKEGVNGKSVFLVLDDLWNQWQICWQDLLRPLKFAQNVTILVTTRSKEVARLVQTVDPLVLGSLPEDDCWLLLQHYAFGDRIMDEESSLVKLGRKIMHKCGGLPLAVKSIGCLLRSKMDMQTWMEISESEFWENSDHSEEIFSALRLSFYRLPARLKPCFLLCTLCPKGQCFTKNDMIHLWIAHGYIWPVRCKTLEEVASEYFDELNGRSLIETDLNLSNCGEYLRNQLAKPSVEISSDLFSTAQNFDELHIRSLVETFRRRTTKGSSDQSLLSFQWFRLHDMTWDLAKSLSSRSVTGFPADGSLDVANKDQHLFLWSHSGRLMVNSQCDHLRTLVLKCCTSYNIAIYKFTYLRALVLDSCVVFGCISGLQNMKHLRYLHVNNSYLHGDSPGIGKEQGIVPYKNLELLPQTIRHLYSLEKLIISTCWQNFSMQSCDLISLRYLHLSIQFNDWPLQFCQLYNLETLCLQNCHIITQFLSCIGNLINLRHLQLSKISKIKMLNRDSFLCQNNKNNKCQLLKVMFPALEKLEFDGLCNLQEWCGFQDSDCPKLHSITIRNCSKLRRIPYFSSVRKLIIRNLALTDLQLSVYNAPSQLHTLDIRDCKNLNSLTGLRNLCSFGSLCIAHCPELTVSRKENLPYEPPHVFIDDCPGLMEWCFEQKLYYQIPKMVEVSVIKRARQHSSAYFQSFEQLYLDICPEKGPELILSPNNWLSSELRLLKFGLKRPGGVSSFHGDLSTIRMLEIRGCPKLAAVMDLEELNVLHSLVIADCPLLYILPEMKFPPLLSSLTVQGCHRLLSLNLNLSDPSQLIELEVSDCQGLVYIGGLECLSNLESLVVLHCPLLELQEWLPVIPESVTIFLCPKLKKWCRIQSIEYQGNMPDSSYA